MNAPFPGDALVRGALVLSVCAALASTGGCSRGTAEREGTNAAAKSGGQDVIPAATRKGEAVTIRSGKESIQAYVALPQGHAKGTPAIVVIQEWWGLDDWVKTVADSLAGHGYVTIAPDLYRGRVANDPELAHELMRGMPDTRAIQDIRSAAAYLNRSPDLDPQRIGVIGFCMGGRLALRSAVGGPFVATVVCYGAPEASPAELATLRGPVLGIYGGADRGISGGDVKAFEIRLKEAGKLGGVRSFEGAGHAFLNASRPSYAPASASQAWAMIHDFFARELKTPKRS